MRRPEAFVGAVPSFLRVETVKTPLEEKQRYKYIYIFIYIYLFFLFSNVKIFESIVAQTGCN